MRERGRREESGRGYLIVDGTCQLIHTRSVGSLVGNHTLKLRQKDDLQVCVCEATFRALIVHTATMRENLKTGKFTGVSPSSKDIMLQSSPRLCM